MEPIFDKLAYNSSNGRCLCCCSSDDFVCTKEARYAEKVTICNRYGFKVFPD